MDLRIWLFAVPICTNWLKPLQIQGFPFDGQQTPTHKAAGSNPVGRTKTRKQYRSKGLKVLCINCLRAFCASKSEDCADRCQSVFPTSRGDSNPWFSTMENGRCSIQVPLPQIYAQLIEKLQHTDISDLLETAAGCVFQGAQTLPLPEAL